MTRAIVPLCGVLVGVSAWSGSGHAAAPAPRMTTACVGLLTAPTLMSDGVGRDETAVADATRGLPPARVIPHPKTRAIDWFERMRALLSKVNIDTKITEYAREITGQDDIRRFLLAAGSASSLLEADLEQPDRAPTRFWGRGRVFRAVASAAVPALLTYVGFEQAQVLAHAPELWSHWPLVLSDGLLIYLTRRSWRRTARYARAVFDPEVRVDLQNADGDRALTLSKFTDFVLSDAAQTSPRHFDSGYLFAILTPKLYSLLMDVPAADANPRERANYDELLIEALAGALKDEGDEALGLARVDLKYFVSPADGVPRLVITAKTMMQTLVGLPPRKSRPRRTEARVAPEAAWAPVRVRAQ